MTTTAPVHRNLLDLHMPVDPDGSVAAVAPLAWCVTRKLTDELTKQDFVNPYMFIVVRALQEEEYAPGKTYLTAVDTTAFAVPITQAMQYISFSRPGMNEIVAYVVDVHDKDDVKLLRKMVNEIKERRKYSFSSVIDDEGYKLSSFGAYLPGGRLRLLRDAGETVRLFVPREMFAPPQPEWRKKALNKLYPKFKPFDQCDARRRFLLSIPIMAVLTVVSTPAKLIGVPIAYATGARKLNWKEGRYFLNPPWAFIDDKSYFAPIQDKDRAPLKRPNIWTFLNLPVFLVVAFFIWLLTVIPLKEVGFVMLWLAFTVAVFYALSRYTRTDSYRETKRERARREQAEYKRRTLKSLEGMLCETNLPANSFRELPKEKQTVSLRFNDFKTRVCKPFAG